MVMLRRRRYLYTQNDSSRRDCPRARAPSRRHASTSENVRRRQQCVYYNVSSIEIVVRLSVCVFFFFWRKISKCQRRFYITMRCGIKKSVRFLLVLPRFHCWKEFFFPKRSGEWKTHENVNTTSCPSIKRREKSYRWNTKWIHERIEESSTLYFSMYPIIKK